VSASIFSCAIHHSIPETNIPSVSKGARRVSRRWWHNASFFEARAKCALILMVSLLLLWCLCPPSHWVRATCTDKTRISLVDPKNTRLRSLSASSIFRKDYAYSISINDPRTGCSRDEDVLVGKGGIGDSSRGTKKWAALIHYKIKHIYRLRSCQSSCHITLESPISAAYASAAGRCASNSGSDSKSFSTLIPLDLTASTSPSSPLTALTVCRASAT